MGMNRIFNVMFQLYFSLVSARFAAWPFPNIFNADRACLQSYPIYFSLCYVQWLNILKNRHLTDVALKYALSFGYSEANTYICGMD